MTTRRTGESPRAGAEAGSPDDEELPETGPGRFPLGGEFAAPQKGANMARRKSALGRGLSALLSSAVPVDLSDIPIAGVGGNALSQYQPRGTIPPDPAGEAAPECAFEPGGRDAEPAREPGRADGTSHLTIVPDRDVSDPAPRLEEPLEGGLVYLSIDRITPNAGQPRKHFPEAELEELADTIRKTGLLQPIVVRRRSQEAGQLAAYEIVAGERRYRAAKLAGLVKVPAVLKQLTDQEALEIGIIENVQRSNLNPIEEALAYQRLIDYFGSTQAEVAEKVGKDRASIANLLRLLKLEPDVQELLARGEISAGHGRALLMCVTPEEQRRLVARIIDEGLSVRAAEAAVSGRGAAPLPAGAAAIPAAPGGGTGREPASRAPKSPQIVALEERLRRELGTKVTLSVNDTGSGEMRIAFFSLEELHGIVERLEEQDL